MSKVLFGVTGLALGVTIAGGIILVVNSYKTNTRDIYRQAFVLGCTWDNNSKGQQEICKSRSLKQFP